MDKYTIYCTEEQTGKAIKLGAPIDKWFYNQSEEDALRQIDLPKGELFYATIPTATQMIGWLEEQKEINYITISNTGDDWYYDVRSTDLDFFDSYMVNLYCKTREEATSKAIDALKTKSNLT